MKHFLDLTDGICLLLTSMPAMADQAADEAAIRKSMKELNATWNARDLETPFALIDENFVENERKKGKAAHREYLEKLFSSDDHAQWKYSEIDIIFVTSDVAIFRGYGDGLDPPERWTAAWTFSKKSGSWLLSAAFGWPRGYPGEE